MQSIVSPLIGKAPRIILLRFGVEDLLGVETRSTFEQDRWIFFSLEIARRLGTILSGSVTPFYKRNVEKRLCLQTPLFV